MADLDPPDGRREPSPAGVDFAASPFSTDPAPGARTAFAYGERVHWRARFGRPAGSVRLEIVTVARDESGWERAISGDELWLAHPDAPEYAGWLDSPAYGRPGRYTLRIVRGAYVLAEGDFEILSALGTRGPGPVH